MAFDISRIVVLAELGEEVHVNGFEVEITLKGLAVKLVKLQRSSRTITSVIVIVVQVEMWTHLILE